MHKSILEPIRRRRRGHALAFASLLAVPLLNVSAYAQAPSFLTFDSGQVRPLAKSPDGTKLFAVNTPNGTLEIFNITATGLTLAARVPVGLEPVTVTPRSNTEVWVVNHLSDSVSVVSLAGTPRVTRTLLVGDEPRDLVFAGSPQRAFITAAHRGQQLTDPSLAGVPGAGDPRLTTPGVPRADVWIFDPASLGNTVGGTPVRIMSFFTDTPRGLAVSPDGNTVFVGGHKSGNQTTVVSEGRLCNNFDTATPCTLDNGDPGVGGHLGPGTNTAGAIAPFVSLIAKFNNATGRWEDELGRNHNDNVKFTLPDTDVFSINANTLQQTASFAGVGTTLFNVATNPVSGKVYVSNSDAQNLTRFEGDGSGGSTVQGHLAEMRITVISGNNVAPRHLNKHINYSLLAANPAFDATVAQHSLSTPTDMQVSSDGRTLFVAAFGSSKIGVFDTASLENNSFNPRTASANYITVGGGGPSGLVLDEPRGRLYVLTRFDDSVKVVDLASKSTVANIALPNPEPASVVQGRKFQYSAEFSANGEAACASCHIFSDKDDLAWDLGVPENPVTSNPITINLGGVAGIGLALFGTPGMINGNGQTAVFHPMKGPMTTQTLRGLANQGALHWRGDRANGALGTAATDVAVNFNNFIVAFPSLLGAGPAQTPTVAQMNQFTNFQLQVREPPNPVRALNNSLTAAQQRGRNFYFGGTGTRPRASDGIDLSGLFPVPGGGGMVMGSSAFTCNGCHVLNPANGLFGTSTNASFEGIQQIFKIPHLRNMYDKVGMFGFPRMTFFNNSTSGDKEPQVRGTGYTNQGGVDTLFRFFQARVFNPFIGSGFPFINPNGSRRDVEQFVLAFDSDLAPIVGQQVTLTSTNSAAVGPRIDLLLQRARTAFTSKILGGAVTEADVVVKVVQAGASRSFLFDQAAGNFRRDDGARLTDVQVRALATTPGQEVTYTAVPPGSGARVAFSL
jgi:DNA-binding beta-propeller fold protein YncE